MSRCVSADRSFGSRAARLRVELLESREVPATFVVNTPLDVVDPADGRLSLREAVTAANLLPGPDVIKLPAGVLRMSAGGVDDTNDGGDFDVTDALTVRGAGAGRTVIDAQGNDRLFDLFGSIAVQMTGVALRHGGGDLTGGAIRASDADLTLVRCVVSDNHARDGGGIDSETGRVTLVGSTVCRNVADQTGGGIRVGTGALALTGSTVRRNQAGFKGGGISADSVTLVRCTVSDNTTALHGGLNQDGGGGGISATTAELVDCVVAGNSSGSGGGVFGNTATLTRCTVSGNITSLGGGGLNVGTAVVTDSTIRGNAAGFGFTAGDGGGDLGRHGDGDEQHDQRQHGPLRRGH